MADVTATQFQQDVNNTADWANGDENTTVTMRLGQQARSPAKVIDDIQGQANSAIQQAVNGFNLSPSGFDFATGGTLTSNSQTVEDAIGNDWVYTLEIPVGGYIVTAGTVPSEPAYKQVVFNSADNVSNANGGSVQDFIDNIPTEYDLFIIYGQSNAVGFAGGTFGRQEIPDHAFFWYNRGASQEWRPLEYDMPFIDGTLTTTSTGHAYIEFAREYTKRTGRGCLFIPAAYGGLSITQLSPPSIHFDALANAIAEVKADTTYNIRATRMLWHQGESDMTDGTTRDEYISLFISLWNNIKAEIGEPSHCYMAKVGNPQSRPEQNRYAIQVAQDYLAYNVNDISMGFAGCGSFVAADGMLRPLPDATHYTQKGYNLMGLEMAKSAVVREATSTASTKESNELKGFISTPNDQAHRAVGCTLIHDGTDFVLKTINDGGRYRSSFVQSISVVATGIVVTTSCTTDDIITMQVGLNRFGQLYGLTASIRDAGTSGALVIELFADVSAYVDTVTGAVTYPDGVNNGLLSNVSATVDAGITKISYPAHFHKPVANAVTSDSLSEFVNINQQSSGTSSTWIKYETVPANETRALVNFKRKPIDISALVLNGLQINLWCVLGDRSL